MSSQPTCPALRNSALMTWLMMEEVKIAVILVCAISCIVVDGVVSVSVSCMMAYDEGGAPAVLHTPECTSHWVLNTVSLQNQTANCQFATLRGRREYQEDRIACNLNMNIPFLGEDGPKEARVGVLAVFDGHGGKEASEMASNYLLDYFFLHVIFGTFKQALPYKAEHDLVLIGNNETDNHNSNIGSSHGELPVIADKSIHRILKEALLRTIHDIDTEFTLEALNKNYISGSTVAAALLLDGKLLAVNVGDSKVLMCSERPSSHQDAKGSSMKEIYTEELSRDHHPDREDEKARIKAAGGFVRIWGVPRVNGILAVSRSIGDVNLKRYGVIAVPEIIGWRRLSTNDSYLVIASDGVFEGLTPQNVCDLLGEGSGTPSKTFPCLPSYSLADCIVNTALRKGSTDNLSAIVVPLKPLADFSREPVETM